MSGFFFFFFFSKKGLLRHLHRYRKLLSHFHLDIRHPDPDYMPPVVPKSIPIIGFSATFSRHDGLALGSVFERLVYHRDVLQMIDEDWLVPFSPFDFLC